MNKIVKTHIPFSIKCIYNFVRSLNTAKNNVKPYIIGGDATDAGPHTMDARWQLTDVSDESC